MLSALAAALFLSAPQATAVPPTDWEAVGEAALAEARAKKPITKRAKNVILFVADGMDITTVTAGRIYAGQEAGKLGEEHVLAFEALPYSGLSKTYNTNMQTADSAGTATAMMTGHKTKSGVISVDETVPRGDCAASKGHELPSMMDLAAGMKRSVGVVSTARITHATPATVYAHAADRNWEADTDLPADAEGCADIASQLIGAAGEMPLSVVLGGGRSNFLPAETADPEYADRTGKRGDGRNLLEEFKALGDDNAVVTDASGLAALDPGAPGAVLGLFEPSHMRYELDRAEDEGGEPSLAEMTDFAIDKLSGDRQGYFLLVEAGRIDHAHHAGNAARALGDLKALDEAVALALEKTKAEETLIIVTADHGHTLALQGYPKRGNPILGVVVSTREDGSPAETPLPGADGKPYTTLAYTNGPGSVFARPAAEAAEGRPFVTMEEAQDKDYLQQSLIPGFSESHGGQDVPIYARGPMAHYLTGTHEQNVIYWVMKEALEGAPKR